ncbi:hypothetical protein YC2023_017572 [Brassica napus]
MNRDDTVVCGGYDRGVKVAGGRQRTEEVQTELDYGLVCAVRDDLRADWSMSMICVRQLKLSVCSDELKVGLDSVLMYTAQGSVLLELDGGGADCVLTDPGVIRDCFWNASKAGVLFVLDGWLETKPADCVLTDPGVIRDCFWNASKAGVLFVLDGWLETKPADCVLTDPDVIRDWFWSASKAGVLSVLDSWLETKPSLFVCLGHVGMVG